MLKVNTVPNNSNNKKEQDDASAVSIPTYW